MTHPVTWSNPDNLVVGFGRNVPEREAAGVMKTEGTVKEARLHFTYESTFGESDTYIQLPRMVQLLSAHVRVDTAWTSSDASLAIGHTENGTADVDALFTITALDHAALTPAGLVIAADGTYFADTNSVKIPAVLTDDADDADLGVKVFITSTEGVAWTTGEATLIVRYVEFGY